MQSVCGFFFYSHLCTCDVGTASIRLIVLIFFHMEHEKNFVVLNALFIVLKLLPCVLSLSHMSRYRIIYMEIQI